MTAVQPLASVAAPVAVGIAIRGLTARYPGARRPALQGIDLEAGAGAVVVLGPTGAGKSTLLRVLAGQLPPDAGVVRVAGRDVARAPLAVRTAIGYAPQEIGLPQELTLREYLDELSALGGVPREQRGEAVRAAAAALHLRASLHRRMRRFSGGMKRRALLAQALLHRPPVLLFDEPTAGLDPAERIVVLNLLRAAARETCVIVASHVADDAAALPGRVVILQAGRLLLDAPTDALLASAKGQVWAIEGPIVEVPGSLVLPGSARGGWRVVGAPPAGLDVRPLPPAMEDAYFLALLRAGPPARAAVRHARGGWR